MTLASSDISTVFKLKQAAQQEGLYEENENLKHYKFNVNKIQKQQPTNYIPQSPHAQYLGLILDKRLTWKQNTTKIAATCRAKLRKLNWLLKPTGKLSLGNKVLLFKAIVMPSMTYCIQLWGMASDSNVMKVQRVQNRALRMIADAPWYVRNDALTTDLHVPSVREQINRHSSWYNVGMKIL